MVRKRAAPGAGNSGAARLNTGSGKHGKRTVTRRCRLCDHVVSADAVYCYQHSRELIRERIQALESQGGRQTDWLGGGS